MRPVLHWGSSFRFEFFHDTLNQLFGVSEIFHDELHIHDGLARPTLALAIHPVLTYQRHCVGHEVHGDREASSGHAHAGFEVFELFLLFAEDGHEQIVMAVRIILRHTALLFQEE